MGQKAPDERHHFGHARIETLASAAVGLALVATALYLGIKAAWNINLHVEYHPTALALIAAAVSIALKEALYHYSVHVGRRIKSRVVMANAWHHRSDALSSVAVLLGVAGARVKPSWHILDAYAALIVSFFILKVAFDIIRDTLREFVDTAPEPEVLERIGQCTRKVEGVIEAHDLRVRILGGVYQMETHIVVDGRLSVTEGHLIAKAVEKYLMEEVPDLDRVIVHVDPEVEPKTSE
jgi:cation diffusion facilitator family transporter